MKNDFVYLKHILESTKNIDEYIEGFNYDVFIKDKKTIAAVVRELEVIGEAAGKLSDEFKAQNLEIPFRDIIDMRNFLIHEYFGVDTKVVWDTCKDDLPKLKGVIEEFLARE